MGQNGLSRASTAQHGAPLSGGAANESVALQGSSCRVAGRHGGNQTTSGDLSNQCSRSPKKRKQSPLTASATHPSCPPASAHSTPCSVTVRVVLGSYPSCLSTPVAPSKAAAWLLRPDCPSPLLPDLVSILIPFPISYLGALCVLCVGSRPAVSAAPAILLTTLALALALSLPLSLSPSSRRDTPPPRPALRSRDAPPELVRWHEDGLAASSYRV